MDFGKRSREALKVSWIPIEVKFPEHEQVVLISAQNRPDTARLYLMHKFMLTLVQEHTRRQ